jgi:hypothetical protein
MEPNFSKIRVIHFTKITNVSNYQYKLGNPLILQTDCNKDLGVHTDGKHNFYCHFSFLFSHAVKVVGLVCTVTFPFFAIDSLLLLYFALVGSKLEYAFVALNSVTDSNKLEHIQMQ